jgi:hypothetical protein
MYTLEMNTAFIPDSLCQILPEDAMRMEVEFNYLPSTPDKRHGHPDTWYQGDSEEFEITNIYYYRLDAWWRLDLQTHLSYDEIGSVEDSLYNICKEYAETVIENNEGDY